MSFKEHYESRVLNFLSKYAVIAIYLILGLTLLNTCHSCNTQKKVISLVKKTDSLSNNINQLTEKLYNKDELNIRLEILGNEMSKNFVYDNNTIARTTKRPDDVVHEYDQKIKELQGKLK